MKRRLDNLRARRGPDDPVMKALDAGTPISEIPWDKHENEELISSGATML